MAIIEGTSGNDWISTTRTIPGQPFATNLDDILHGYAGDDLLDGAGGADEMTGGLGNDRYYVDNVGDQVIEAADEGNDSVYTTLLSFDLGTHVEYLKFIGSGDFVGTGNELANRLIGGAGADTLDGGGGNDRLNGGAGADGMFGGLGNDRYHVDHGGDAVIEAADEGIDTIYTTLLGLDLAANVEKLRFIGSGDFVGTGNELANALIGGAGVDTLDGAAGDDLLDGAGGADEMTGGLGNDRYYVDNVGDQVIEVTDEGNDSIYTTLSSLGLSANVEYLKFIGSGDFVGTGNELANRLIGGAGADTLDGGGGNDRLNGGAGADVMFGGLGNDRYHVDRGGDAVIEAADEGIDTIHTTADYALIPGQHIENLQVSGTAGLSLAGNELNNSLLGGVGDDTLNGGAGIDKLNGSVGADLMAGGIGSDIYYVDDASDIVFEEVDEGTDTVYATTDYELTAGYEVEIMRVLGSDGLWLTGNEFNNVLYGGIGEDLLEGGEGDDRLLGGAGTDFLDGGSGADRLEGGAGNDLLNDCACDFDDVLIGGDGDDYFQSGGGADQLSGGDGADVFAYLETADSTHARRDTILDFEHGVDILDFSLLADGNIFSNGFVTVTTAPTTIDAYTILALVSARNTILYVNNTDTAQLADTASMEILMRGITTLTESDLGFYTV
jgi:Ca2+-binding RTX toxin-like protein